MDVLNIVVPCYNEEDVLSETNSRLTALLARLVAREKISPNSRVCYVDDGSRDATWSLIRSFIDDGGPVVGMKLSRNRGHQNALLAGLLNCDGDIVVSIDADLQDDVNAIEEMIDQYHNGNDVVYGVRSQREKDSFPKRFAAQLFYRLMKALGAETVYNHADYRLMSRRAIESLRDYREVNLYLRGIIPLLGFKSTVVTYSRETRFAGESKYSIPKMLGLALDGVTSFSVAPLRLISGLGFLVFLFTAVMSGVVLWQRLITQIAVPGWASTLLPVYFLGGVQILCLGVIGEYLGKIYGEIKARPRFSIEETVATPSDEGNTSDTTSVPEGGPPIPHDVAS